LELIGHFYFALTTRKTPFLNSFVDFLLFLAHLENLFVDFVRFLICHIFCGRPAGLSFKKEKLFSIQVDQELIEVKV
jgi:hypothetical protein